ncbi:unnamed protein product [Citrullus colocynthis]|uniref:Uncharacterized protein n=1 Tax=Citrullus colocynthis TaxID=252529 RepID=A0ABP0Z3W7_9ROSI
MGIHTKKPDMISNTTNNWVNSLSFSGYLNSKDREQPNSSPDGFKFAPTPRGSSVGNDDILVLSGTNRSSPYIERNNSIRRRSQEIGDKENKSPWSSGWSVFRSFVSPSGDTFEHTLSSKLRKKNKRKKKKNKKNKAIDENVEMKF